MSVPQGAPQGVPKGLGTDPQPIGRGLAVLGTDSFHIFGFRLAEGRP